MTMTGLGGLLPVMATPFDSRLAVDEGELAVELDWLFAQGADGIVVAMVSEIQRLSQAERIELNDLTCRLAAGRGPVIASVGAESTVLAADLARRAHDGGAAAVMAAPPLLTPVGEDELRRYLAEIVEAAQVPVILQDASGYVGHAIDPGLQARLVAEYGTDRLLLKPEAAPIGPMVTAIHSAATAPVRIFDGSGGLALVDTHARGIVGTMPGPDLVWALRALWDALEAGDHERAMAISRPLVMLQSMVTSLDAYIAFEKYLLVKQGILRSARSRGPLQFELDDVHRLLADSLIDSLSDAVDPALTAQRRSAS